MGTKLLLRQTDGLDKVIKVLVNEGVNIHIFCDLVHHGMVFIRGWIRIFLKVLFLTFKLLYGFAGS